MKPRVRHLGERAIRWRSVEISEEWMRIIDRLLDHHRDLAAPIGYDAWRVLEAIRHGYDRAEETEFQRFEVENDEPAHPTIPSGQTDTAP